MNTWLVVLCALLAISTIVFAFLYFREKKDLEEIRDQAQRALSHQSEDFEEEKEGILNRYAAEISAQKHTFEQELSRERLHCEQEIEEARLRTILEVRKAREEIESRKNVLAEKEPKELLIDVMVALENYSSRFERLEKSLHDRQ